MPGVDGAGQAGEFGDVGVGAVGQPSVERLGGAVRSGLEKIRRRSWAAIQVRASCSSGVSPASNPVSSRAQERSEWWSWPRRSSRRIRKSGSVAAAAVSEVSSCWIAAAHVVDGGEPEAHDVEGVEHPHRVRQRGAQRGGVAPVRVQRRDRDPGPATTGPRSVTQLSSADALRSSTRRAAAPGRPRRVRSTMPVTKLVERVAEAARNAVSSTPSRRRTPAQPVRVVDPRGAVARGRRPSRCPTRPRTRGPPRRPRRRPDRPGGTPRREPARSTRPAAAIAGEVSVQVLLGHSRCAHRQTRLTHTSVTGRPAVGRSRIQHGRDRATRPPPRTGATDQIRGRLDRLLELAVVLGHRQHDEPRQTHHRRCSTTLSFHLGPPSPCP